MPTALGVMRTLLAAEERAPAAFVVAVVLRVGEEFFWPHIQTPPHVWQQLSPRDDSQIGFQELLGFVLLLGTFHMALAGAAWISFGDTDGITHSVSKGGGHHDECNVVIGKVWLGLAKLDCDLHVARVESKANIADGPPRDDFSMLHALGAVLVEPVLPNWINHVWFVPE